MDDDDIFGEADDMTGPLWRAVELMAEAPPPPAKGYVTAPLAWLRRVRLAVRSVDQFIVLLLLYRRCLMRRSRTVTLPNGELAALGISRQTKYRLLGWLQSEGVATVEAGNGRATRVTLHWFP